MKNKKENFIFFGTPEVASKTLEILKKDNFLPSLIITSPDKPQGRKMIITPHPVKLWAIENNIPYLQPEKIDDEFISKLSTFNFQLSIVVAYGKILPEELINLPKLGTINVHYSLLPKYRGASPVEQVLLNGDNYTGVSIQKMRFKLDSGPIIKEKKVLIEPNETKIDLLNKLINIGGNLLVKTLPNINKIKPKEQDESKVSFTKKIIKSDGLINLDDNPIKNWNKYKAFYGWPGTYFFIKNKEDKDTRIKIKEAIYENDSFIIKRVTPEGKKEISFEDFKKI